MGQRQRSSHYGDPDRTNDRRQKDPVVAVALAERDDPEDDRKQQPDFMYHRIQQHSAERSDSRKQ